LQSHGAPSKKRQDAPSKFSRLETQRSRVVRLRNNPHFFLSSGSVENHLCVAARKRDIVRIADQ
jgi:hypothetical protein